MKNTLSSVLRLSLSVLSLSFAAPSLHLQAQGQTQEVQAITEPVAASSLTIDDASIDTFIEELMVEKQIPGLSLAVIHDQKLIKAKGYGMLNRELNVKVRPSSIFPIASMSKPLTATAIMLLVEDGKVDLDAPISRYLTSTPTEWEAITVRRLINHTAGLSEDGYSGEHSQLTKPSGFVEAAGRLPLDFQPGESWMYSNTGFNIAAAIVEEVSEQSFETFMKARIFDPLAMNATDVIRDSYKGSNLAMGYALERTGISPIDIHFGQVRQQMKLFIGSGSITSNVVDLARWAIALQKGQLLSAESQTEMTTPGTTNSGLSTEYALGWLVSNINSHKVVTHGGNLWGYSTSIAQFPDDKLTIVALTNKDNEYGDNLTLKIAGQYSADLLLDEESPAIADTNPEVTTQLLNYLKGDDTAIETTSERQIALSNTTRGQYITDQWTEYRQQNSVTALELIEQSAHANGTRYRYRVVTADEDNTRLLTAVITTEGLVSSMGIGPYSL